MKVTLASINIDDLPKKFRKYAYGQDEHNILVDMAVGEAYDLYGYREYMGESFYLVRNPDTLWWMPARLYAPVPEEIKKDLPSHWKRVEYRFDDKNLTEAPDLIIAPQIYHENSEDIEDNTPKGQAAFKRMAKEEGYSISK